jgi:hypothetical protein
MFERPFRNIDDALHKQAGRSSQTSQNPPAAAARRHRQYVMTAYAFGRSKGHHARRV